MKFTTCLNLLGVGAIAVGTVLSLQPPGQTQPEGMGTTVPDNTDVWVVPVIRTTTSQIAVTPQPPQTLPQPVVRGSSFFCGRDAQGTPTTFVNLADGNNIPLIRWVSDYFEPSGYTADVRCQDVSQRFARYYSQGILNYVTTGYVNNQPVVCVASQQGGSCREILFTLKSNESATRAIQQLFDARAGASGPLLESGERIYIDMKPYTKGIQANR